MKQLFLFFSVFLAIITTNSQVIYYEDFSSGTLPAGWTIDQHSDNWDISTSNYAGGEKPELKFNWSPDFNGNSYFISPSFDLTDKKNLHLLFKHSVNDYDGGYTVGAAYRCAGGNWTTIWSENVNASIDAAFKIVPLPALSDSSDVQIAFFFSGNSYNINYWYIDDITLQGFYENDLMLYKVSLPKFFKTDSSLAINFTVLNSGMTEISSFDAHWQIDDGEIHNEQFSDLNIASTQLTEFTFDETYNVLQGMHKIKIWIDNVNNGADTTTNNDTLTEFISGASKITSNMPLFEEFTSSTCSPCATFNRNTFNPFLATHQGQLTVIKYQMNWPGSGDPYYTDEGGVRRVYYGVSYVPWLNAGGHQIETSSSEVNNAFNALSSKLAYFDIIGNYIIDGNNVKMSFSVSPYVYANNIAIRVAIVEDTTTGNVGSNGETEFYHVMMKMVPNANGIITNVRDGININFAYTQDMSSTHTEEMDDLSVVVFIQDEDNHEILQSAWLQVGTPQPYVSYNIQQGATDVATDTTITITFNMPMTKIDDSEITNDNIQDFINLYSDDKANIDFSATIDNSKKVITITPDGELPEATAIHLAIADNQIKSAEFGSIFVGDTLNFITKTNTPTKISFANLVNVYPIPSKNLIFVDYAKNSDYIIYSIGGKILKQGKITATKQIINISDLENGIYLLEIKNRDFKVTKKIIVEK